MPAVPLTEGGTSSAVVAPSRLGSHSGQTRLDLTARRQMERFPDSVGLSSPIHLEAEPTEKDLEVAGPFKTKRKKKQLAR